jgi:hypothetical protein
MKINSYSARNSRNAGKSTLIKKKIKKENQIFLIYKEIQNGWGNIFFFISAGASCSNRSHSCTQGIAWRL